MPKKIDFYRLPRPMQDRFAAATRRSAPPAPLLFDPAPRTRAWGYLGASGFFVAAAAILLRLGLGQVTSPLALHGTKALAVDVALLAAAAYGVVHAAAILRALEVLPWRPGVFLFPAAVVDARRPVLQVWSVSDAEAVERVSVPGPGLALRMRDGTRVIVPASAADVERADAALESLRGDLAKATAEQDPHMLAELDPLHDSALSSPIGPTEAMKRTLPAWIRLDWAIALGVGIAAGLTLGTTRNAMSDEAMYRALVSAGGAPDYRLYLAQGGKHASEVRDVLLPRAELRDAEAQGTIESVKAFASAHPSSKIGPEIDAALRRVMLAELEKAKKVGTVAALDEFVRKYPDHVVDRELKAARHALYAKALSAWKEKAQADTGVRAFMERLLAWAEKNGAASELRFRPKPSKSLDEADKSAIKSGHYPGPDALPSKFVTPAALRPREERVEQSLAQACAAAFPSDVLSLQPGESLAPDAPLPMKVPTLVVEYSPEWSHGNTASMKPNTVFAGFNFTFEGSFALPEGAPLKVLVKAWRGAEPWKFKGDVMSREDFEQKVYDAMIDGAFDQLSKKLSDMFFQAKA
jgi:hypothetical protein